MAQALVSASRACRWRPASTPPGQLPGPAQLGGARRGDARGDAAGHAGQAKKRKDLAGVDPEVLRAPGAGVAEPDLAGGGGRRARSPGGDLQLLRRALAGARQGAKLRGHHAEPLVGGRSSRPAARSRLPPSTRPPAPSPSVGDKGIDELKVGDRFPRSMQLRDEATVVLSRASGLPLRLQHRRHVALGDASTTNSWTIELLPERGAR